jgi:hypothetical protein
MKSYLQHLENNEAILLMYLADELPPQDRAEVEKMLAADPALRTDLENLRQTQQLAIDVIESLDSTTRPPVPPITAQNQVSSLIHKWIVKNRRASVETVTSHRFPWWRTSFATAAAMLITYYIWAVYHAPGPALVNGNMPPRDLSDDERLALLYNSLDESNSPDTSEASNLRVAEVASLTPAGSEDVLDTNAGSDSNSTGEP